MRALQVARAAVVMAFLPVNHAAAAPVWMHRTNQSPVVAITDSTPLERRAGQVVAMLDGRQIQYDSVFSAVILKPMSAVQLQAIATQYRTQYGSVTSEKLVQPTDANGAQYQFVLSKGYGLTVTLHVEAAEPHLIDGIFFANPVRRPVSLDNVTRDLKALPGHVSFLAARVDSGRLTQLVAVEPDRALGIGSAFKLYILAELVRSVAARERRWSDVVALESAAQSLPSGTLQSWPVGAPITLQTLATLMILCNTCYRRTNTMRRRKLTLTVDEAVVARAHAYSEVHGTSISQLVTDFLASLPRTGDEQHAVYTPTVRRLLGLSPSETELDDYWRHLDEKYAR